MSVALTLHQDIQYFAFLIHRSPQVDKFPVDLAEYFIEVPCISAVAPPVTKAPGVLAAELQAPQPNRFMRDHHAAFQHHFLDIAETQAVAKVQPDAMGNDLGGEAISPVARCGVGVQPIIASWLAEVDNAMA